MPRRFALCACAALCYALPLGGAGLPGGPGLQTGALAHATQPPPDTPNPADPRAQARALLHAAESRVLLGDIDAAVARALLARALDPEAEIPQRVVRAALAPEPPQAVAAPLDVRVRTIHEQQLMLQRDTRSLGQRLDAVEFNLRDRTGPEPIVQRLERNITDLQRQIDRLQSEVRRLDMEVQRLRNR